MFAGVMDGVRRFHCVLWELDRQRLAGLRIGLVERRTGAGDGDADAMAGVEDLADPAHVKREFGRLAGREQRFVVEALAVAGPPGVIDDQDRAAVGICLLYTSPSPRDS